MGFNHVPLNQRGVLLVGDSGGMVSPFNGEGISYAMEAGQLAAEVVDRALTTRRTMDLDAFDMELRQRWGGYYQLGKVFAELVGNPTVMHVCTEYGMPHRPPELQWSVSQRLVLPRRHPHPRTIPDRCSSPIPLGAIDLEAF